MRWVLKMRLWISVLALVLPLAGCAIERVGGPEFVVSSVVAGEGELSPRSMSVRDGSRATFTATPASGWVLQGITGCNGTLEGTIYETGRIRADCTIHVSFEEDSGAIMTYLLSDGTVIATNFPLTGDHSAINR
ncbi:hypothetical protein FM042_04880 [Aliidiomarina halalkaliphila]|uniref:Uncharacterized protein n=2 Tax=Pseudomonadota TaxID=1224 RepID=A0A552X567_9GAMM|nr:hypothetical protein [Aliidiomarina halalkaliphila]TRW50171.1 hypothetical protein FM042_04880 [Aliidiomarina halalkaliphila]